MSPRMIQRTPLVRAGASESRSGTGSINLDCSAAMPERYQRRRAGTTGLCGRSVVLGARPFGRPASFPPPVLRGREKKLPPILSRTRLSLSTFIFESVHRMGRLVSLQFVAVRAEKHECLAAAFAGLIDVLEKPALAG